MLLTARRLWGGYEDTARKGSPAPHLLYTHSRPSRAGQGCPQGPAPSPAPGGQRASGGDEERHEVTLRKMATTVFVKVGSANHLASKGILWGGAPVGDADSWGPSQTGALRLSGGGDGMLYSRKPSSRW